MSYLLRHKATNTIVAPGDKIKSNEGLEYEFVGFSRGRLGPKLVVRDKLMTREFFSSVFYDYIIEEIED